MDDQTVEFFDKLSESVVKEDWRKALNFLFLTLRKDFVFDNLVIYLVDTPGVSTGGCLCPFAGARPKQGSRRILG